MHVRRSLVPLLTLKILIPTVLEDVILHGCIIARFKPNQCLEPTARKPVTFLVVPGAAAQVQR